MGKKYQPKTRRLAKWLYQFIDRHDYGLWDVDEDGEWGHRRANTKERLNAPRVSGWNRLQRLTMTQIEPHLFSEDVRDTVYYTTSRKSAACLLKVDIDAKNGERDAPDAANWICSNWFEGAYWERSTGGAGVHLYLLVDFNPFLPRNGVNSLLEEFGQCLRLVVADEGFEAQLDKVCGYFSEKKNGLYTKMARLAKIPKVKNDGDLDRLLNAPRFQLYSLKQVVDEWAHRCGEETGRYISNTLGTHPTGRSVEGAGTAAERESISNTLGTHLGPDAPDGYYRKLWAVTSYRRIHQQIPTPDQALEYYESNCTTTGPRDAKRIRDITNAIRQHVKTYDSDKIANYMTEFVSLYPFQYDEYLTLAKQYIQPDELEYSPRKGRRCQLTYADVAAFMSIVCEICFSTHSETNRAHAARKRIIGCFRKLKSTGQHPTSCNANKYQALLFVCRKHHLIEIHVPHVKPEGILEPAPEDDPTRLARFVQKKGIGRLLGPGVNHPRYAEFMNHLSTRQHLGLEDKGRLAG